MNTSSKVIDITIQKNFKNLVDAKREGKNFDFKSELKKELEMMLQELSHNNSVERGEIENLLQEIERRRLKIKCIQ
ncbi:MAG: hypothetical protein N4A68_07795 [Maledivibacter sp.]|jgi:cell division FtsZ-interacting protein ZapD|nr:hypothetical protein [Maledivibacter sp.]